MTASTSFHYLLFAGIGIISVSCGNETELTTESAPEIPAIEAINDLTLPDYAVTPAQITLKDISGTVFNFAPDLDTSICESFGECDCCTDDYLFTDDAHFIRISYCMADQRIFKGTYEMNNAGLVLNYDSTIVERVFDEEMQNAAIATGESRYTDEITYMDEIFSQTFTAWKCKKVFFLMDDAGEEIYYGTRDQQTNLKNEIEFLKVDGTWDLIQRGK